METWDETLKRLGKTDVYLLDQFMKGRFRPPMRVLDAGCGSGRNLDLFLYDIAGSTLFTSSESESDNSENIWFPLAAHTDYRLTVALGNGQLPFEGDYALAWQVAPVPLPASVWLMGIALAGLGLMRGHQPGPG